jgi:hypothetical protein
VAPIPERSPRGLSRPTTTRQISTTTTLAFNKWFDADTDLRLSDLWKSVIEAEAEGLLPTLDDVARTILATSLRQAYSEGYSDASEGWEPSLAEYERCEPWLWSYFPEHDKLSTLKPLPGCHIAILRRW